VLSQANATALLPNVATCISGAVMFSAAGDVDWTAAALVALSAAATTRLGARAAHHLPERTQKLLFGTAMLGSSAAIACKPMLMREPAAASQLPAAESHAALRMPDALEAAYFVTLGSITGARSCVCGVRARCRDAACCACAHAPCRAVHRHVQRRHGHRRGRDVHGGHGGGRAGVLGS
jgi:hypothetical protein